VWIGRSSDVDPSANIVGPVAIGDNVKIGRGAVVGPRTTLGHDVEIGEETTVSGSVAHDGVRIDNAVVVRDSTIGANSTIGHGTEITAAVIGARVAVGADNELREGIRLWPGLDTGDRGITFTR
jgi:mannose-1-phosphate guanylyltransferase